MVEETIHKGQNQQDEPGENLQKSNCVWHNVAFRVAILIAKAASHEKRSKPFCKHVQSVVKFAISTRGSVETESPLEPASRDLQENRSCLHEGFSSQWNWCSVKSTSLIAAIHQLSVDGTHGH